jgi:hypothetical protein
MPAFFNRRQLPFSPRNSQCPQNAMLSVAFLHFMDDLFFFTSGGV